MIFDNHERQPSFLRQAVENCQTGRYAHQMPPPQELFKAVLNGLDSRQRLFADFTCTADVMDDMRGAIIRHSRKIIIPMDSSKIGRVFPSTHIRLSEINTIISDDEFPEDLKRKLIEKGVEIL